MSNPDIKEIIQHILSDGVNLTNDLDKLRSICEDSKIIVNPSFQIIAIESDPMTALQDFYGHLGKLPVIKIAAKMITSKYGIGL